MKQTLVIGSTVVDVFLTVPVLPLRGNDINVTTSEYRIGGCAYNVYKAIELFKIPAMLCSPVGFGVFGRMVREQFRKEGLRPIASLEIENGCCYCLIEPDGERTFMSHHGAEYLFSRSWLKDVDFSLFDNVFICGIDVEEPTGLEIIEFIYEHPELKLYFAPGPRISYLPDSKIDRIINRRDNDARGPFFHLNEKELFSYTKIKEVEEGAEYIAGKTNNSVVVTLGDRGCYCLPKAGEKGSFIPGFPMKVVDTVGSGDAHCGTLIACLKKGMHLEDACFTANRIGSEVVGVRGAVLNKLPF